MAVGRTLGWLLILGALLIVANETYVWLDRGTYHIIAAGELWYRMSPGSLNFTQAIIQRYIHPALWDDILRPVLLAPAWLVLGAPGILLLIFGKRRKKRRRRHPSRFG